ncbi:MAG: nuclear transport factor 2 family protein [Myxococcota bacterium]|nr:nuclear transport factor 2 family protein [Myxococcota bacterium]
MQAEDLQLLVDKQAISEVLYNYAAGCDRRDWALFRACFCDPVEIDLSTWNGNPPALVPIDDWVAGVCAGLSGFDATHHLSGNHRVEVDGDRAHATSNIQASHVLGSERVVLGGWYDTRLLRQEGRWRIARSQLNVTWREGNEELFAQAAARHEVRSQAASAE